MPRKPNALTLVKKPRGRPFEKGHPGGPGRPKGRQSDATLEVREAARAIIQRPAYLEKLKERLDAGKAPHIEQMLWFYAFGRPKDQVQTQGPLTVRWLRPGEEEESAP